MVTSEDRVREWARLKGTDENGGNVLWRVCMCRIRMDRGNVHAGNGVEGTKKSSDAFKNRGSLFRSGRNTQHGKMKRTSHSPTRAAVDEKSNILP